ncbi:hypothetical protein C0993_009047 [Termitomyces sp. T159_Od127]|nr:hypothetical protein C0993_009047 [Termitomyces sp. T159_Od127]
MMNNPMMLAGDKRIVPGPNGVNLKTSRSLIISPDLDALLEYDEKIRRLNSPVSPTPPQQPLSAPTVGLPPPPRRICRKPTSPTSPIVESPLVKESSRRLECENPYINPAPVFEFRDVLEPGAHGTPTIEVWSASEEPCSVAVRDVQKASKPPQDPKERVGMVASTSNSASLFNDADEKVEYKTRQLNTSPTQRSNLRERARAKGKLPKLEETVPLPGSNDNLMDIRRHPTDSADDLDISRRQRPFISRRRPSRQGSSSSSSRSSTSTYEPASTIDTRISISSTMYPTSPSIFVDEPLAIGPPDNSSLYSDYFDRHSFIDVVTPAAAEFTLPPSPPRTSDAKPTLPDVDSAAKYIRPLSPATNFLELDERSGLIRQNRKLARVFGKPPGPNMIPFQNKSPALHLIAGRAPLTEDTITHRSVWLPASDIVDTRSHSVPLSVRDDFLFDHHDAKKISHPFDGIASSMSFIDLSDDLGSAGAAPTRGRLRRPSPSLIESVFPEERADEARRRKREKLARLHRFLGSRVPTNLVLGLDTADPDLPPLNPTMSVVPESRKDWLRRRRSSSAAAYRSTWSDEIDRVKEDLNSTEKAINVRRAQKMEKVFGVAPPQTLYHTRRSPSPSVINAAAIIGQQNSISGWTSPGESQLPVIGLRNVNRTSYSKKKSHDRPGTSESDRTLLPRRRDSSKEPDLRKRTSAVYTHYQDSLNSLNDIIDRDDKESLAELHEYLNLGDMSVPPPLQASPRSPQASDRRLSNASIKSERRHSLPARTSISSEYTITTPRPDVTDFQMRRRRAAKLTQFFGVNYRELIKDVLESIESGLEHERNHGTLKPEEVEDLLARLRNLRTKRTSRRHVPSKLRSRPAYSSQFLMSTASPTSDDEFSAYNFSEFTEEDLQRIDADVARISQGGPQITIQVEAPQAGGSTIMSHTLDVSKSRGNGKQRANLDSLSPMVRYRQHGVLSVMDLASLAWCEVQFDYGLRQRRHMPIAQRPQSFISAQGKEISVSKKVAAKNDVRTKQGAALHKVLEREVKAEEMPVEISSKEEQWALRLVNMLASLHGILLEGYTVSQYCIRLCTLDEGFKREVPVFGILQGEVVVGIIDEVVLKTESPTTPQKRPSSSPPRSKSKKSRRSSPSSCSQHLVTEYFMNITPTVPPVQVVLMPPTPPESGITKLLTSEKSSPTLTSPPGRLLHLLDTKTRGTNSLPADRDTLPSRIQLMIYHRLLRELTSLSPPFDFAAMWQRVGADPVKTLSTKFLKQAGLLEETDTRNTSCLNDLSNVYVEMVQKLDIAGVDTKLELVYRSRQSNKNQRTNGRHSKKRSISPVVSQEERDLAKAIEASLIDVRASEEPAVQVNSGDNTSQLNPVKSVDAPSDAVTPTAGLKKSLKHLTVKDSDSEGKFLLHSIFNFVNTFRQKNREILQVLLH